MVDMKNLMSRPAMLWIGGAALLAAGAVGGAGAVGLTRPGIEVAPIRPVAIASLAQRDGGLVTVRGKVAEVYGDRFTIADGSGKTMVDAGRDGDAAVTAGQDLLVQGRYDNGQLHASFLIDGNGSVRAVGPLFARGPHRGGPRERPGPGGAGPGHDGPPSPGCDAPPPPAPPAPAAVPAAPRQ
jgi:uncharacterized protein YdeI (BOF family)